MKKQACDCESLVIVAEALPATDCTQLCSCTIGCNKLYKLCYIFVIIIAIINIVIYFI